VQFCLPTSLRQLACKERGGKSDPLVKRFRFRSLGNGIRVVEPDMSFPDVGTNETHLLSFYASLSSCSSSVEKGPSYVPHADEHIGRFPMGAGISYRQVGLVKVKTVTPGSRQPITYR
jgi:hypothetical protein